MKITHVRYRKLVTGPGYSHQALEAEAAVEDGETPEDAALKLSCWVRAQIEEGTSPLRTDPQTLREEIKFLDRQRLQLHQAVNTAQLERKKLQDEIWELENRREKAGGESAIPF